MFRGWLSGRNFPARGEAAEMIYTQEIKLLESESHAVDPPFEAIRAQPIPIVERVAP